MRAKRAHGRILSVETLTRGSALAEDAAAGATSITVVDAGDFEETDDDGPTPTAANPLGWLTIGSQVVAYLACDDDAGVIDLAEPLAAAGEEGDTVAVWSELYEEAVEYQQALVELEGRFDNPEPVEAEVAEEVDDLPEGDRGKPGESCTLHRMADDEWEVVAVGGRGRQSQGVLFYQDSHTVAAAGAQTVALTHLPIDNSEHVYWNGLYQPGSEWTRDGRTITVPDSGGFLVVGDEIVAEYAYRKGIATPPATPDPGSIAQIHGSDSYYTPTGGTTTTVQLPPGTQVGDLIVLVGVAVTTSDPRFTNYGPGTWNVYVGYASDLSPIAATTASTHSWAIAAFAPVTVTGHQTINYNDTTAPVVATSAAILAVARSSSWGQFAVAPNVPAGYALTVASPTGFQHDAIWTWSDPAAAASPAGAITYGTSAEGWTAVAIGIA